MYSAQSICSKQKILSVLAVQIRSTIHKTFFFSFSEDVNLYAQTFEPHCQIAGQPYFLQHEHSAEPFSATKN